MMKKLLAAIVVMFASFAFTAGQAAYSEDQFRVYDRDGNAATIDQLIDALRSNDVLFLGEEHNDGVAHALEAEIFRRAVDRYAGSRKVALSLEMFERDVQIVVDEYLAGLISQDHFLLSARPWPNYKTDYRPLVELAKEKKLDVIAANAPRRYVNMVSRNGRGSVDALSKQAKSWLAPLPYGQPSAAYAAKFRATMEGRPEAAKLDNIVDSQALWDATMANSVAKYLSKNKNALVVHLNGSFHTESRLGTVEHLLKYRPKTKALVVTMHASDNFKVFDKVRDAGLGDYVILTQQKTAKE